ncbi:benzoate transporter [Streptomyces rubellomurinus subsp. indigoferus]|uniref:Benzoate transporter n=1 Tax=Streptomyces rubellomurinus (strain ATCC 31215) TaxID=359131 RepID=A0A0F2TLP8_STRR3|nr:benzoate/H(+) symporter BenE family transporter [Streptomyces rubellomurinus]KJS56070.1 benzoate transporter [Streptomyces rubellomurinus subsp. indigoferus]KJS63215.1 benzoate transporter [Streptomyces rubellomurinus]
MTDELTIRPRTTPVGNGERRSLRRDVSGPALLAGLVCVAVSFSGPLVVVLAAAKAGRLDEAHTASWIWAVAIGSGVSGFALSWWTRTPVVTAWSTPGAALLVTSLGSYPYREAVGAFLVSAVVVTLFGVTGWFGRLIAAVPVGIVNAMLAGILFSFGAGIFGAVHSAPVLVVGAFAAFLLAKRLAPRYAVPVALLAGGVLAALTVGLPLHLGSGGPTVPVLTAPAFSGAALVGLALPLTIVVLASQNAPGLGVMRAFGYRADDRLLIGSTGAMSLLMAPFGSPGVNLAAITAAICSGPEAHPDPSRRYVAGMSSGVGYVLVGSFGGVLVSLFTGLPKELVAVIAGVALLASLQGSLAAAVAEERGRDAAVVTFLASASGMSLFGIGSAFWGLLFGLGTHLVLDYRRK